MAKFPAIATPVRVIGGSTGSNVGPIGATGPVNLLPSTGEAGLLGPTGLRGLTGPAGMAGLASLLTGIMGPIGPTGGMGYHGPAGPTGTHEFIPADRAQYYEYIPGIDLPSSGSGTAAGCKFMYQPKRAPCILFSMFTGILEPTYTDIFQIGIATGAGAAPNGGEFVGYGNAIEASGEDLSIPFMTMNVWNFGSQYPTPDLSERWYDLATYGGGGKVRNIACIVIEF